MSGLIHGRWFMAPVSGLCVMSIIVPSQLYEWMDTWSSAENVVSYDPQRRSNPQTPGGKFHTGVPRSASPHATSRVPRGRRRLWTVASRLRRRTSPRWRRHAAVGGTSSCRPVQTVRYRCRRWMVPGGVYGHAHSTAASAGTVCRRPCRCVYRRWRGDGCVRAAPLLWRTSSHRCCNINQSIDLNFFINLDFFAVV